MNEDSNQDPRERLRNILSSNDDETSAQSQPQPQPQSPLAQLPRLKQTDQSPPSAPQLAPTQATTSRLKIRTQGVSTHKPQESKQSVQQIPAQAVNPHATQDMPRGERFRRALWTMASLISMAVNVVVIIVLVVAFWAYRDIKLPESIDITMVNKLLSGLYSNFEKMDRAHIKTEIPISTDIPVQFDIQINTQTNVVLSQDVTITGARVTLQTGGLEIVQAPTNIILPAGTVLPINLNLTVPVDKSVPVNMTVPVDIALNQTDLHDPFVGLQEVLQPVYCLVEPTASNLDGQLICR